MRDDITVLYSEGEDDWGEPLEKIEVKMKAYIVWDTHLVRNIAGEKVISSPFISRGIAYIMPDRAVTHKDRIKIGTIEHAVLDARPGKDFSENHQEIHLA